MIAPQSPTLGLINPNALTTDTSQQDENLLNPAAAYGSKQQANDLKALAMQQRLSQQMLGYGHKSFPTLDLSPSANWGEGLAKGLGNSFSLHQHFNEQKEAQAQEQAYSDMLAGIQQKQGAAQKADADHEQGVADMVNGLTFKQNDGSVLTGAQLGLGNFMKANPAFGKALFTHLGNTFGDSIPQPFVGMQEGQGKVNEATARLQGANNAGAGADVMNGVINPVTHNITPATAGQQNTFEAYTGKKPITTADIVGEQLENTGKKISNTKALNELGAQPQQLQQEAQARELANKNAFQQFTGKVIENHFATRDHELEQEAKVATTDKQRREAQDYNDGKAWWNDPATQTALTNPDPKVQHYIETTAAKYKIPYKPFTHNIVNIKTGLGAYTWFDKTSNQIFKDGKWQAVDVHK